MTRLQETETIQRASTGDSAAWEQLYYQHRPSVRSWCWQMTHNSADADDLTQEVFLRFFLGLATFRHEAKLRTWLYRVTVNCVLMYRRKSQAREVACGSLMNDDGSFHNKPEFLTRISTPNIDSLVLRQAIDTLPIERRSVLVLHDISGMSHGDIAERLCLSVENSKRRLRRARLQLRGVLVPR
jgi:RNA polymerase sigma-70 factor (ECF subfamily)